MSKYEKISLPLREEDGSRVCRTFTGEWLAGIGGMGDKEGLPWMGFSARWDGEWGDVYWYVIRSKSGKLVVYQEPAAEDGAPSIAVYDSFDAMRPHVPARVHDEAARRAGLIKAPHFPEVPLEGV